MKRIQLETLDLLSYHLAMLSITNSTSNMSDEMIELKEYSKVLTESLDVLEIIAFNLNKLDSKPFWRRTAAENVERELMREQWRNKYNLLIMNVFLLKSMSKWQEGSSQTSEERIQSFLLALEER